MTFARFRRRPGLSLVELLTAIGVIGLMVSLLLPAVQKVRESARRTQCANNLRQVGLALHSYHGSFGVFPTACGMPNYAAGELTSPIVEMKQYSALTQLLPYLDQVALFAATNFQVAVDDWYLFPTGPGQRGSAANATVINVALSTFACPSDPGSSNPGSTRGTNYRVNMGTDRWSFTTSPSAGPMGSYFHQGAASTTDGLSNTVAFCEKLRGNGGKTIVDARTDMIVGGLGWPSTADESLAYCSTHLNRDSPFYATSGLTWFVGTLSQTCYNHVIVPNGTTPDCILALSNPVNGLIGARSNHPMGVQAAFADGSGRFINDSIRREVWKAVGTCAAGETFSQGDF